jgi:hypothetical protein
VSQSLIYSPLDDSRVKDIWGAYILSLSELPSTDFNTQDDQVLLRACEEAEVDFLNESESDMELRGVAEAAEACELLESDY